MKIKKIDTAEVSEPVNLKVVVPSNQSGMSNAVEYLKNVCSFGKLLANKK